MCADGGRWRVVHRFLPSLGVRRGEIGAEALEIRVTSLRLQFVGRTLRGRILGRLRALCPHATEVDQANLRKVVDPKPWQF